jgi:hypothetical protein
MLWDRGKKNDAQGETIRTTNKKISKTSPKQQRGNRDKQKKPTNHHAWQQPGFG